MLGTLVLLLSAGSAMADMSDSAKAVVTEKVKMTAQAQEQLSDSVSAKKEEMTPKEITTESGLKYIVLKEGAGAVPKKGDMVKAHYTGWLVNGTKFDSSVDRGEPLKFQVGVGQVIKGWDEALLSMKVGEKRKLTIPGNLAYGKKGYPGVIPPDATLIFDVELLEIVK
jgi:FKBP-type peptidyl-prolyl cis-trans isomerase